MINIYKKICDKLLVKADSCVGVTGNGSSSAPQLVMAAHKQKKAEYLTVTTTAAHHK